MNTLNDLKYTLRLLKKTPVFSLICLLVVTFGVAIVLILFSFVKNTYFQEMPFVNGDRFVAIKQAQKESGRENDALPMNGFAFNAIKNGTHSFETLGAFQSFPTIVSDVGMSGGSAEMYLAAKIMPNLLAATAVNPISGRLLRDEDTGIDTVPVVLISYRLWQNYYLGDMDIIGKKTRMNAEPYSIVGVMPEGYAYPTNYDLWFPLAIPSAAAVEEPAIYLAVGVLSRDSNLASATVDVKNVLAQLRGRNPTIYNLLYGAVTIHARHTQDSNNGTPELLGGMALIIVLLVCVNLGSLFLVRANTRVQELAIRNAVGAGRWQIITQVLTESLILCVVGAMLGVLIAETAMQLLQSYAEGLVTNLTQRPFWQDLTPDSSGITFVIFLTLAIWLLSGSFAAIRASGKNLGGVLESGSKGVTDKMGSLTLRAIVVVEVTLSFSLLILCGLNVLFTLQMTDIEYGADSRDIDTAMINLTSSRYQAHHRRLQYVTDLADELRLHPVIGDVTISTAFPGQRAKSLAYNLSDAETREHESLPQTSVIWINANYFDVLNIDFEGRQFDTTDTENTPPVVIVDSEFAADNWPNESALGKQLQLDPERDNQWLTVVGVSQLVVQRFPIKAWRNPTVYRYVRQDMPRQFTVGIKSVGEISAQEIFKAASTTVDRDIPVNNIKSLVDIQQLNLVEFKFFAYLLTVIASVALFLAVVGIYGIISRSIFLRANEIGIRRAIGSTKQSIIIIYLRQGIGYLFFGAVIGGGAALALFNMIPSRLTGTIDIPFVYGSTLLIFGILIILASYLPVRKIVAMEPGDALHYE